VDPIARDEFWRAILELSRKDKVTIFISTHFMNEAIRCDRIALMHAGKVLETGSPEEIIQKFKANNLEEAFNDVLIQGGAGKQEDTVELSLPSAEENPFKLKKFSLRRLLSYSYREAIELIREPIRLAFALLGSIILLSVVGTGISLDIENLTFAVLDQDQSSLSRDYVLNLAGSRYFSQKRPLQSFEEIDKRLQNNDIGMALIIPPNFEQDVLRRSSAAEISVLIDGALPTRAETISGYAQGMHQAWLTKISKSSPDYRSLGLPMNVDFRYRYNPDVKSIMAIIPAMIPILLMLIPAILSTLSVVREKELGSIINLYVTPVSKLEFLIGKQIPYVIIATLNFILLAGVSNIIFKVPMKGSYLIILLSAFIYAWSTTGIGLLVSAFTKSQISALLGTAILTILPTIKYSGLLDPLSSLDGALDGEYIKDAVFSSSDGTLYLGGIDGFSIFHPDKDSIHPMLPDPPVFTALRLYGEKVNTGKEYGNRIILSKAAPYTTEIELDYNQNFLTFEFSALNYINHERTYYRYQLEGIDPQWMSTFAGRQGNATVGKGLLQAVYTNLPPGDYTFKVMASDNPLQWNGKVTAIKLTIHAPWWKTTTAYILYAVILLLIAFTGIRLYIYWSRKEMERKHKEEILLLRIRNLIEQNNSLTCGIEETSPDHQQQDTEESAFLAQAIKLVEQNLHVNGYSVEQLSRDLCMERTGLYRKLVTMLDQSPSLFIRNIRLQRAAQLITEGKLSITEIAEHTGFSSSSYLSKCFQEMYGCRPSEYAEKAKKST
jgi:AraC-like DNA-binding protein/ABC-type multidrug transport system permease subunit